MPRQKFNRIVLHVGHDKTGSTAIQCALDHNRGILLQDGWLYPGGHWHAQLGSFFHDTPATGDDARRRDAEWMENLQEEFATTSAGKVILSYEGFFTLPENALMRIREFAMGWTRHVKVIAYCRSPYDYAVSAISQRVKSGKRPWDRYTGKLAELCAGKFTGDPDWRLGLPLVFYKYDLEKLARVFGKGNIALRKFGRNELSGGDVVTDFLAAIHVNESLIPGISAIATRENPSLSSPAIQIGTRIIGKLGDTVAAESAYLEKIVPLLQEIPGRKPGLGEDEARVIREASRKESAYLEKEWGMVFGDTACPEAGQDRLTEAEVESMAMAVMTRAGLAPRACE